MRTFLKTFLATFLYVAAFASFGADEMAPKNLVIMGDSLSAGYGLKKQEDWPALLLVRLQKAKRHYSVINLSISGETTAGGHARLAAALKQNPPTVLIIALGANDGLRGLPLLQMGKNLQAMIDMGKSYKAKILLAGMRLPPNFGSYADDFHDVFSRLAEKNRVAYLPFLLEAVANDQTFFQADQLHPTAAAQSRILDSVWEKLQPLL